MVVIGDGAPARTEEIVAAIAAQDPRVSYQGFPKGPRLGEAYRDPIIRDAREEIICHLSDDDIWGQNHLASMVAMLSDADWVYQAPLILSPGGRAYWRPAHPGARRALQAAREGRIVAEGLNNVAYRRAAYLRLPEGWAAAPDGHPSDWFMWQKFLSQEGLRVAASAQPQALKLASRLDTRAGRSPMARCAELGPWLARINAADTLTSLRRQAGVLDGIFVILGSLILDEAGPVEDVLAQAGMSIAPEDAPLEPATNETLLRVPMTQNQRHQVEAAIRTRHALRQPTEASQRSWAELVGDDARFASHALAAYTNLDPGAQTAADALLAQCFPMYAHARRAKKAMKSLAGAVLPSRGSTDV